MPNRQNQWIKKARAKLIQDRGGKCKQCGSTEKLQFAHIAETGLNGIGRGRKERYYDVINHPYHYILLCKNCHVKLDSALNKPKAVFK